MPLIQVSKGVSSPEQKTQMISRLSERDSQEDSYTIRYVTTSDADSYRRILDNTSSRDRYYRFFNHIKFFDDAQLRQYVKPHADVVSMIAEDGSDPLGVAQAVAEADGSAEFAVIISSHARRRGVATSLFGRIITALQARGITRLVAFSLADNEPFARFATACGMESEPEDEDGVVAWALDVTTGSLERGAAATGERAPIAA